MFLHARGVIKRRLAAAKAEADKAAGALDAGADQVGQAAEATKRSLAEAARAEFVAAFDRFDAVLRALEADTEGAAVDVIKGIDRPVAALDRALGAAGVHVAGDESAARDLEHADSQAAIDATHPHAKPL